MAHCPDGSYRFGRPSKVDAGCIAAIMISSLSALGRSLSAFALLLLCCGVSALAQSLQITSPATGSIVSPGQTLTVGASASGDTGSLGNVVIVGETPIGASQLLSAAPYQFVIQIPSNIEPGPYALRAVAGTTAGNVIASGPVYIDVERTDQPVSVTVQPPMLTLPIGNVAGLRLSAVYADGSAADVSRSTLASYASNVPTIATVTRDG